MIRKLDKAEFQQATTLALEVYLQCGQDDFEDEGLESFKSFIFNDKLMNELCMRANTFLCFSSKRNSIEKG